MQPGGSGVYSERDTWHFAKRQLTWFRRENAVTWLDKQQFDYDEEKILEYMIKELGEKGIYEKHNEEMYLSMGISKTVYDYGCVIEKVCGSVLTQTECGV